jgi:hypothetical protein
MNPEIELVRNWHMALNSCDVDKLVALVGQHVTMGGPHGLTQGAQGVREWFERASVRMYPTRFFQRDHIVVVEEAAQWRDPETGAATRSKVVATVFEINDGVLSRILRCDDLPAALAAASLSVADELPLD